MQNGFALVLLMFSVSLSAQTLPQNLTRFAFGSCNDQTHLQPLWKPIMESKPDVFIWGGDAIYADWDQTYNIQASYDKQKNQPDYKELVSIIPVIGTWDDHDFSGDNADGFFSQKKESQKLFLDFLNEPADSPRRQREGVYTSYNFGAGDQQIKMILLDNRYFKNVDPKARLLGEAQWLWLEEELKNSSAGVNFIMAGLSIVSPLIPYTEEWAEHATELNRLTSLIQKYKTKGVVFLSGDKHFSSIYRARGYLEFMSSGMTHIAPKKTWWYLGRKYDTSFFGLNYGLIDIAWEGTTPIINLAIKDRQNREIHSRKFKWVDVDWVEQKAFTPGMIVEPGAELVAEPDDH
jgi:alkaline phosphatase D